MMKIEVNMHWRDTQSNPNSQLNLKLSMTSLERKTLTNVVVSGPMARD